MISKALDPSNQSKGGSLDRRLLSKEYFTLAFGSMVGVGWLVIIDDWLSRGGPFGAMGAFLIGGLMLLPIAFVYGKLVRRIPNAGSELAYASLAFNPRIGFLTGWVMTLAYLIVCPWEAVAIGKIIAYVFPALNIWEVYRIGGKPVYLTHLAIGIILTIFIMIVNYRGLKLSAAFQNVTTFGLLLLFAIFSAAGFAAGKISNLQPPFSRSGEMGPLLSILLVLQIVPYFMTGFEAIPKCSEEASPQFKSKKFAHAMYLAIIVGTFFYVTIIGVVAMIDHWQTLAHEKFATAAAFQRAFKSHQLVNIILLAAVLSLFKVFNGNFISATRLVFALGRETLVHPALGKIHRRFGTPTNAILFAGGLTALGALFGEVILIPITEVGSFASALGWLAACSAYIAGAGRSNLDNWEFAVASLGAAVSLTLVLMKLLPFAPGHLGRNEYLALALWICLGLLLAKLNRTRAHG